MEFGNIETAAEKVVSKDGKLWGLKEYAGRRVHIVVPKIAEIKKENIILNEKQANILKKAIKYVYVDDGYEEIPKARADAIMDDLNKNKCSIRYWFEIMDSVGTCSTLTKEERKEISPVYDAAQKIFYLYSIKEQNKLEGFE